MTEFLEILKYTIPALVVFATTYFIVTKFIENDQEKRQIEICSNSQKLIVPIRLQAYERLALFLERISPDSLIMRSQEAGMNCMELQKELLTTIRAEFEHNLSQQIYISKDAWKIIKNTKESIVKLVSTASANVKPESPAIELSKLILNTIANIEHSPIDKALEMLKKEIQQFY